MEQDAPPEPREVGSGTNRDSEPVLRARAAKQAAAVVLLLAAATGVRLISLPDEAVWYDEIATLGFLDAPSLPEFLRQVHAVTPVPPAYSITQYYWSRAFGDSVFALRLLSLVYGIGGIAALYALGRALFGHRAGLIAAAWLSLNFWHIYHSQEIRFYGATALLGVLSVWTFVRFLQRPAAATLTLHSAINAVLIWTHPHGVFMFAAFGLFLLGFRRRQPKVVAVWTGLHLLLAASLAAFFFSIDREVGYAQTAWLRRPTFWGDYPSIRGFLAMGSGLMEFMPANDVGARLLEWRRPLWILAEWTTLAGFAAGLWLLLKPTGESLRPAPLTRREIGALLVLWFVIPPLLAYVGSHAWRPIFQGRYLVFAYPPIYLALGYLFQRWRVANVAALAPLLLFDALFYFPGPLRAPYDQVVETIEQARAPDQDIYIDDMIALSALKYYWTGDTPEILGPGEMEQAVDPRSGVVTLEAPMNWLLLSDEKRANYMRGDLRRAEVRFRMQYYPALRPLWLFRVPGPPAPSVELLIE